MSAARTVPEITDAAYIAAAKRLWERDGEIEVDASDTPVSRYDDTEGAYVLAWVWVPADEVRP